jgi:two-component system response regulator FixJ
MSRPTTRTVSVVEDDGDVRESIRIVLESCGYAVKTFASAVSLLHEPGAENVDCLLLDLNIPGVNGLELLELLRSRGVATPAIFLTADGKGLMARMNRAGVVKVLSKPASADELTFWIERACNTRR